MDAQIDEIMKMLDGLTDSGSGRIKIEMSEDLQEGEVKKTYHHGRCDVNSPFACGTTFNNMEEK